VGGLERQQRHAAGAGVAVPVPGEVQRAVAPQVEGVHVVVGDLARGRGAQPGQEPPDRGAAAPGPGRRRRVQVVQPGEQGGGRVLQEHRGELVRVDGAHRSRSGNRWGVVAGPLKPSRLTCRRPSSPRNVWAPPPPVAGWNSGPADRTPGPGPPPAPATLQTRSSCWAASAPASSACAGGMTYRSGYLPMASRRYRSARSAGVDPTEAGRAGSAGSPSCSARIVARIAASLRSTARTGSTSPAVNRLARYSSGTRRASTAANTRS